MDFMETNSLCGVGIQVGCTSRFLGDLGAELGSRKKKILGIREYSTKISLLF